MRRGRRRRHTPEAAPPLSPAVAAALVFLSMLSSTLLIPAIRPFFAATHPTAEGGLFWFMSVNMLGAVVGAPLLGAIADAVGKRWLVLIVAAVVDGAFLFLCSLPLDLDVVLVLRTLQGAGNVAAVSLLMGLTTPKGVPIAGGATIAAIAAGAPLGTLLLRFGPEVPLQVGAMLPLVVAVAVGALQPSAPPGASSRAPGGWGKAMSALPAGLLVFAERFAIGLFIVPFMKLGAEVRGFDNQLVGWLFGAFLVPFAVATAAWSRFRGSSLLSIVVGALAYAFGLAAAARVEAVPLLALVLVVGGVGAAGVYAPALHSVARLVPANRVGAAMGLVNALGALGMGLGSPVAKGLTTTTATGGPELAAALTRSFDAGAVSLLVLVGIGAPLWARQLARPIEAGVDPTAGDDERPAMDKGPR